MFIKAFNDFDHDAQSVRYLSGNCGRQVKRAISRHFQYGKARIELVFPGTSLLEFAFVLERAMQGCEMAMSRLLDEPVSASFTVTERDVSARRFVVLIESEPHDQTVKALQAWFRLIAEGLARVSCMVEMRPTFDNDRDLLDLLLADDNFEGPPEELLARYVGSFEALASGDLSQLQDTPATVAGYAALLNPALYVHLASISDAEELSA